MIFVLMDNAGSSAIRYPVRATPKDFTRSWFAWQNSLFGELIIKLINDGKLELLNSITVK